jgi:hypothetical protein
MDDRFRIKTPCDRQRSNIARVGKALYCDRCEKNVVDLTRATRREALALAPEGSCVRLRVDGDGNPVFRPEIERFTSGRTLAIVASLVGGCAAEPPSPTAVARAPEIEAPVSECMIPLAPDAEGAPAPIAAVEPDVAMVAEATQRKRRARTRRPHAPAPPPPMAPPPYVQQGGYEIIDGGI